ncbi:Glycoside hydrolase, family 31 [Corchorus olitorius]|uniref:Glycoside hydrolase, family 31 n=1 Tax=Corchorus olitorius TaxID=93759 RepID=A0A1R3KT01_9ROSI|nr:Glycoside hydrolase, family 31 [Corchorus olitorius]
MDSELCLKIWDFAKIRASNLDVPEEVERICKVMGAAVDVSFDCAGFNKTMSTVLSATHAGGKVKGLPICRHLFLHYPDDEQVQRLSYHQFLVGSEILVVPMLDKRRKNVKAYFPLARYMDRKAGGSLGSFSDDINRLLQLYEEEDDDATSPLKGPAVLKPKTDIQNLSPSNLHVIPKDYLVNHEPEEHGFQGFDPCKVSTSALESTMVGNVDINYQLDYHPFDLQQEFDHGLLIGANGTEYCARDANPNVLPNISPPPSAFMGPKCALWDCATLAQGFEWYQDYCSNFHATLALNEDPSGMTPILRPGGINLKDNLLLDALQSHRARMLVSLNVKEWLFFDKPRRAFESGNRKQRLELKLANEKKSPKVKVTKDSLADLQKKMGRLTAEVPGDDRSPGKGKTKANKKADAKNVNSAQDWMNIKTESSILVFLNSHPGERIKLMSWHINE